MSSMLRSRVPLRLAGIQRRGIWGVAPEPVAEPLIVPLADVNSPVPLFDGPTPTKVLCGTAHPPPTPCLPGRWRL